MRKSKLHLILLLILVNLFLVWYYTHSDKEDMFPLEQDKVDVTVIIPSFENFDNDIKSTVKSIDALHPGIQILVLANSIPYPYFHLPSKNSQFVVTSTNPLKSKFSTDPLHYVHTKYILVLPDGVRINGPLVLQELLWDLQKSRYKKVISSPVKSSSCSIINIDLKRWFLKYELTEEKHRCDTFIDENVVLFEKELLGDFMETFTPPFFLSFFIQAKLRNISIYLTDNKYFRKGRNLFLESHYKWKHSENLKSQLKGMYKRYGIKRSIDVNAVETYYGCSKTSKRCFPTVLDVPYYLYEGRWTPPCCLNALRETSQHVFKSLETMGLEYWLEGGSLLGAARYADIIPWDYDVDLGIFMTDITKNKFLSAVWNGIKQEDKEGFVWEKASDGDFIRVQYSVTNHLHVDIFPFYEQNGIMTKNTWFKTHRQDMEFPAHYLKPLKRLPFVGVMASVPNNHLKFLELKFGKGAVENPQYPFPEKLFST